MLKSAKLEAYWRGHVEAWRALGGSQRAYCDQHGLKCHSLSYWHVRLQGLEAEPAAHLPLTLIPASILPDVTASLPCLALTSPAGWRLEFGELPPAGWLAQLWERPS
jgi:hypothetical protein